MSAAIRIEAKPTVVGLSPDEVVEYFGELQDGTQFIIYRPREWEGYGDFRCLLRPPEYDTFKLEPIQHVARMRDGGTTRITLSTGSFLFPSAFRREEPTFNNQPLVVFEREKVAGSSRAEGQAQDAQAEGPGSPSAAEQSLRSMRLALEVALEVLLQRDILLPGWEQDWGSDPEVAQCIEVAKRNAIQFPGHVRGKVDVRSDPTERQRRFDEFAKAAIPPAVEHWLWEGGSSLKDVIATAFQVAEAALAESDRRAAGAKEGV